MTLPYGVLKPYHHAPASAAISLLDLALRGIETKGDLLSTALCEVELDLALWGIETSTSQRYAARYNMLDLALWGLETRRSEE